MKEHPNKFEVVESLKSGENIEETIRFLYKNYRSQIGKIALFYGGDQEDARDLFQEVVITFLRLVKHDKYDPNKEASLGTYLSVIAKHKYLKKKKGDTRRSARELNYAEDNREDSGEKFYAEVNQTAVWEVVGKLGEKCKNILRAYYYFGYSLKDIAEMFDYGSEGSVKVSKYRCMKELKNMWNNETNG